MQKKVVPFFLAVAVSALTVVVSAGSDRIKVYIFATANESGFTDQGSKDRDAAVKDATSVLAKSKAVLLVDKATEADVTLEVTRRVDELAKTSIAKSMWKNNSWSRSADSMQPFLYATVKAGSFSTEIRSTEPESKGRAGNLAKVFEEWLMDNRAQVLAQRSEK